MSKRRKTAEDNEIESDHETPTDEDLLPFQIDLVNTISARSIRFNIHDEICSNKKLEDEWTNRSGKEKVEFILERAKDFSKTYFNYSCHTFHRLLRGVKYAELRKVYSKHIDKKQLNKDTCIKDLFNKFYGKTTNYQRRKTEKENLEEIGDIFKDDNYRFIKICNISITSDIVGVILSYLPRNSSVLYFVGSVCKHFYLQILYSWKNLVIKRSTDVNGISLIVLRNIEYLEVKTGHCGYTKITQTRLNYIWKNIGTKLKSLKLEDQYVAFALGGIKRLRNSKQFKPNNDENESPLFPVSQIRHLELYCYKGGQAIPEDFKIVDIFSADTLNSLSIRSSFGKGIFEGLTNIRKLKIKVWRCDDLSKTDGIKRHFQSLNFPKKISSIELLGFNTFEFDKKYSTQFSVFFELFSSLENLTLNFNAYNTWKDGTIDKNLPRPNFDLSIFDDDNCTPYLKSNDNQRKLRKLVIKDKKKRFKFSRETNEYVDVNYPSNLCLEELCIYSSKGEKDNGDIDFNFQEILTSKFLSSSNNIERVKLSIPLLTRDFRFYESLNLDERSIEDQMEIVVSTINNIIEFLMDSKTLLRFKKLELEVLIRDKYFAKEKILICFDKVSYDGGIRRLMIKYNSTAGLFFKRYGGSFEIFKKRWEDDESLSKILINDRCIFGLFFHLLICRLEEFVKKLKDSMDVIVIESFGENSKIESQKYFSELCQLLNTKKFDGWIVEDKTGYILNPEIGKFSFSFTLGRSL